MSPSPRATTSRVKGLPPGQVEIPDFPSWGPPEHALRKLKVPSRPVLSLGGDVRTPCEVSIEELVALRRHEEGSDFHWVAAWSRRGLRWSGYRFRDFFDDVFVPLAQPEEGARYLVLRGLDGYWTSVPLEDALADDVMLADYLDGEPLSLEHGAPLRLVAPAHYGYKNAKHLCRLELRRDKLPGRGAEHPRGRVVKEERGQGKPGREFRVMYSVALESMLHYFRNLRRPGSSGGRGE